MADNFQDRMFLASESVYASIERGEYQSPAEVEAALMDAHLKASSDGDQES